MIEIIGIVVQIGINLFTYVSLFLFLFITVDFFYVKTNEVDNLDRKYAYLFRVKYLNFLYIRLFSRRVHLVSFEISTVQIEHAEKLIRATELCFSVITRYTFVIVRL